MKEYIYIGQLEDPNNPGVAVLPYKKIGKTTVSVIIREKQINNFGTKMPLQYRMVAAWEVNDCDAEERFLHQVFSPKRVQGEFFDDVDNSLINAISVIMSHNGAGDKMNLELDDEILPPGPGPEKPEKGIKDVSKAIEYFQGRPYTEFFNEFIKRAQEVGFTLDTPPKSECMSFTINGSNIKLYLFPKGDFIRAKSGEIKVQTDAFGTWEEYIKTHKDNTYRSREFKTTLTNADMKDIDGILEMAKNNPR